MAQLLLKFVIMLEDFEYTHQTYHHGPVFNKWLPNGAKDSIQIKCKDDSQLSLWFERYGSSKDSGIIEFSYEKKEVDPDILSRQTMVEAGPLFGKLELFDIQNLEVDSVVHNKIGDVNYIRLGKRVVKDLIYPNVKRLIDILRITHGQYWIKNIEKWDSRKLSLGAYCSSLQLKWSRDGGRNWSDFLPDENITKMEGRITIKEKEKYIKKDDWDVIKLLMNEEYKPSLASSLLAKSHEHRDQGEIKYALIDAVTALEIAIEERITKNFQDNKDIIGVIDSFWNLPMPTKLTIVSSLLSNISSEEIQSSIESIKQRNAITHEGKNVNNKIEENLDILINVISKLLVGPKMIFPFKNLGPDLLAPKKIND